MTQFNAPDIHRLKLEIAAELDRPPQGPALLYACLSSELPDASDYTYGAVIVTDLGIGVIAFSNGSAWVRSDTGAAI